MPTNLGPEADANTIRPPGNLEVAECILHLADGPKGQRADSGGFKILAPIFLMSHIKKWSSSLPHEPGQASDCFNQ